MLALAASQNKQYSANISKQVTASFNRIDANGGIRNKALFGYRIIGERYDKRFEIVEDEAELIRDAAKWYLDGQTLAMICRKLNDAGRLTRTGNPWSPKTLGQVLRSETLIGRRHQGTKVVKVPSILSVRDFKAVQAKLDSKAYRKGVRTRPDTAFLTSILYCGIGHPLYRINAGKGKYAYYDRHGCKIWLPMAEVDQLVLDYYSQPREIAITREVVVPGHDYRDDADQIALQIRDLDPASPGWLDKVTEMHAEMDHLRKLTPEEPEVKQVEVRWEDFLAEWDTMNLAQKREFLLGLSVRIYAFKRATGDIDIVFSPHVGDRAIVSTVPASTPNVS
jgi:hypothetical protein